jgi:hypothetical protein
VANANAAGHLKGADQGARIQQQIALIPGAPAGRAGKAFPKRRIRGKVVLRFPGARRSRPKEPFPVEKTQFPNFFDCKTLIFPDSPKNTFLKIWRPRKRYVENTGIFYLCKSGKWPKTRLPKILQGFSKFLQAAGDGHFAAGERSRPRRRGSGVAAISRRQLF